MPFSRSLAYCSVVTKGRGVSFLSINLKNPSSLLPTKKHLDFGMRFLRARLASFFFAATISLGPDTEALSDHSPIILLSLLNP